MDSAKEEKGFLFRYGTPTVLVAVATLFRMALNPVIGEQGPFVFYFLAIFIATYLAGFGAGIYAMVLSSFLSYYLFFPPTYSLGFKSTSQSVFLLAYFMASFFLVSLTGRLRREIERGEILERDVRHGEETFRGIFENAREDAMVLMDADRRVVAWNAGAEQICGWSEKDVLGKSADLIFTEEDQRKGEPGKEAEESANTGLALDERWHVRKDGSRFWGSGTLTVLRNNDGTPRGYLKIFRDETERKRLEELLHRANEDLENRVANRTADLERVVKELEGFTYSISHDMRAPLRSMVANSKMLLEDFGSTLPEGGKEHLDRISNAALKMAQLVEDLLIFARLGRAEVKREPCDLGQVALEVVLSHVYECELTVEPGSNMSVECDPSLTRLVLQNLIENACKYRKSGTIAKIEFGRCANTFYMHDDGIGFDMQYVGKIFLPFERLHRDAEYPGTGIGLANAKRVVELHKGSIWAESQPGQGATFYFTLGDP